MSVAQRNVGIAAPTAAEQVHRSFAPHVPAQPLPEGQAGRAKAGALGVSEDTPLVFFVVGDHGGVKDPTPQNAVTLAMEAQPLPAFVYSVGDVVYFNADDAEWHPQFYEAYAHLATPVLSIPGNHDGDTSDDPARTPLDTWMSNFCAPDAALPRGSEEYHRDTQTQPYCDWTLQCDAVTIIGLYSNVPSGGHLEATQIDWLTGELRDADPALPLIVALHHPPYSIDAHHGGSKKMGNAQPACEPHENTTRDRSALARPERVITLLLHTSTHRAPGTVRRRL